MIVFTTAYKDIDRSKWPDFARSNDEYLFYFLNLARNIKYKLVVYLAAKTIQRFKDVPENVIFVDEAEVPTFFEEFMEIETQIMNSEEYLSKVPLHRRMFPEHKYAKYTLVNHSKINYISHTMDKILPGADFYAWIDFGCVRAREHLPENIGPLSNKIIFQCLTTHGETLTEEEMIQSGIVYIAGSQFIVHHSLVKQFHDLYRTKLLEWHQRFICDDDQSLVYQLYIKHPELFQLRCYPKWFHLFYTLRAPSTIYIRDPPNP